MSPKLIPLKFIPGLFTESTDRGADGRWRHGNMVRWNNKMPEAAGGWAAATLDDSIVGISRAQIDWSTLDGINVAAVGTNRRLYLIEGGRLHNITPLRASGTLTDPFTTTNGSEIITVQHPGHGVAEGDYVFFSNAAAVGGITLDGEFTVTEVLSADSYTITYTPPGAGFASVRDVATTIEDDFNSTSITLNMPTAIAGDLLVCIHATPTSRFAATPAGWTQIGVQSTSSGSITWLARIASGDSGDDTTINLSGGNVRQTAMVYSFRDWFGAISGGVEVAFVNDGTLNPPNLVPSWGSAKNLWVAGAYTRVTADAELTDPPANYSDATYVSSASTSNATRQAAAVRALEAGSEDPAAWGSSGTLSEPRAWTLVVRNFNTSADTGGGSVGYEYEITVGGAESGVAFGWGTCGWGGPARGWGTPCPDSTMIIPLRVWSLDTWGEDLIASPSGGAVYVWDRTNGFGARATKIEGAPEKNLRVLVSQENRQLITLGTTDDDGDLDALFIRWSDSEDYTDFVIEAENNAGSKRIDGGGSEIVAGIRTRSGILIWTDKSLHLMQATGDALVFGFRQLGSGVAIAGPNAPVDVNGVVYAMGIDNFYVYDGTLRVLPCDVWTRVFGSSAEALAKHGGFNLSQRRMVYGSMSKNFSEIWWFYPAAESNTSGKLVVYNYRDNLWWYGDLQRSSFGDFSPLYEHPYGFDDAGNLYTHEDGVDANGAAMERFLVSDDLELGDGADILHVQKLVPDFKALSGTGTVTLKGRIYPAAAEKTSGPRNITSSTRKVNVRMRARQVSLTFEMEAVGGHFRMGEWRAEAGPDGER